MMSNSYGRGLKALAASLAVGLGVTACSRDYVVDYLYVTAAGTGPNATTTGLVFTYSVDSQTGAVRQLADSGINTGGGSPVTIVATPNSKFLYVPNQINSTVTPFAVGTDGKIYPQAQTSVVKGPNGAVGSLPTAAAVDRTGNFLYVTFADTNLGQVGNAGPGGVAVFPIDQANGTLGNPLGSAPGATLPYVPVGNNPAGITAGKPTPSADGKTLTNYVYVIDQEPATATAAASGIILAFLQSTPITSKSSNGAYVLDTLNTRFTPVVGPVAGGFAVGTTPSSVIVDPFGAYLYATDSTTNQIYSFSLNPDGSLLQLPSSPSATGDFPVSVTVDPRNAFVYVANFGSNTLSAYTIGKGGVLSTTASSAGPTDPGPNCVAIDPALGIYVYTANKIGNNVSALQLDPHTGALRQVQGTKFAAGPLPSCAVLIPNGNHATQLVQ